MKRFTTNRLRLGAVGLTCAALGAGASAIATAGAATPTTAPAHHQSAGTHHGLAAWRLLRHTVHADLVVATKQGFVNVTVDRGSVQSVSGDQLTLVEGSGKTAERTVQLTLPAATRVRDNGRRISLDQLPSGQRATVIQGPHLTRVVAHTRKRGS